jgi:hypothetical protein
VWAGISTVSVTCAGIAVAPGELLLLLPIIMGISMPFSESLPALQSRIASQCLLPVGSPQPGSWQQQTLGLAS